MVALCAHWLCGGGGGAGHHSAGIVDGKLCRLRPKTCTCVLFA